MMHKAARPNFAQIARELIEGISAGQFPVGSLLPTELELCDHYGTSRHTVRAALNELQQLGLVSRRRNVGTRVEASQSRGIFRPSLSSLEDLVQFGSSNLRDVRQISAVEVTGERARQIGCPSGTSRICISSLRLDRARNPIGWTDVYIEPAYADIGEAARQAPDTLISTLIERRHGRSAAEVHQSVRAIAIPLPLATALEVVPDMPGLEIVRQYLDAAGHIFEASVTVHPANGFELNMTLKRSEI